MLRDKCSLESLNHSKIVDFSSQYFKTYCVRLQCMTDMLKRNIFAKWGADPVNLIKLCDVRADEPCVLMGTLCKEQQYRPSVIKQLSSSSSISSESRNIINEKTKLISDSDSLYLEDDEQRILLNLNSQSSTNVTWRIGSFVTGVVVAVRGYEPSASKGTFVVEDWTFATPLFPLLKTPVELSNSASGATMMMDMEPTQSRTCRYLALISGLQLGNNVPNDADHSGCTGLSSVKLFFDWISGNLPLEMVPIDSKAIGRLIIAGDSLGGPIKESESKVVVDDDHIKVDDNNNSGDDVPANGNRGVGYAGEGGKVDAWWAVDKFDEMVSAVCQSIPVDIMSGPNDPCSAVLPQRPLHRVLFPRARKWSSFGTRPNPWLCYLENAGGSGDQQLIIGISGQTIDDIGRFSDLTDPIDRLEATIVWGHLAPTAPDTLDSYPNIGSTDPLVMPHRPTLYFAGNQDRMSWRNMEDGEGRSSLLVAVPRFRDTAEVVIVDLVEKKCHSLSFK